MLSIDTLRSIEVGLREFRDAADLVGAELISYFLDMAILEARELASEASSLQHQVSMVERRKIGASAFAAFGKVSGRAQ